MPRYYFDLIDDIKKQDIDLLARKYQENQFIDFKSSHPLGYANSGKIEKTKLKEFKKEFVLDVTSFANTSGGYLVYGIQEDNRIPKAFTPFSVSKTEDLERTLGDVIRKWSEPHLVGYKFYPIPVSEGKYILVIEVAKSLNAPHGVKGPGDEHYFFCGRKSDGVKHHYRYSMLKEAFIKGSHVIDRIKLFRDHRVNKILVDDLPVPVGRNAKIVRKMALQPQQKSRGYLPPPLVGKWPFLSRI